MSAKWTKQLQILTDFLLAKMERDTTIVDNNAKVRAAAAEAVRVASVPPEGGDPWGVVGAGPAPPIGVPAPQSTGTTAGVAGTTARPVVAPSGGQTIASTPVAAVTSAQPASVSSHVTPVVITPSSTSQVTATAHASSTAQKTSNGEATTTVPTNGSVGKRTSTLQGVNLAAIQSAISAHTSFSMARQTPTSTSTQGGATATVSQGNGAEKQSAAPSTAPVSSATEERNDEQQQMTDFYQALATDLIEPTPMEMSPPGAEDPTSNIEIGSEPIPFVIQPIVIAPEEDDGDEVGEARDEGSAQPQSVQDSSTDTQSLQTPNTSDAPSGTDEYGESRDIKPAAILPIPTSRSEPVTISLLTADDGSTQACVLTPEGTSSSPTAPPTATPTQAAAPPTSSAPPTATAATASVTVVSPIEVTPAPAVGEGPAPAPAAPAPGGSGGPCGGLRWIPALEPKDLTVSTTTR